MQYMKCVNLFQSTKLFINFSYMIFIFDMPERAEEVRQLQ